MSSVCALGGYALETGQASSLNFKTLADITSYSCHLGKVIRYDTVGKLNWGVSVRTHPILTVIEDVLKEDWDPEHGREVPVAEEERDCVVRLEFFCGEAASEKKST